MKIVPFTPQYFTEIKNHLSQNKIIILPTDTSYGFSGNPLSSVSVKAVEEIKNRENKPFLWITHQWKPVEPYVHLPDETSEYFLYSKKTPTTFLLKKKPSPEVSHYFPQFPEIGVRIPTFRLLQEFLTFINTPLFSTSCNRSGKPPLFSPLDIQKEFSHCHDLLFVDAGTLPIVPPSQIIRVENNSFEKIR